MLDLPDHAPAPAMKNPDFYRQLGSQIAQRRKALGLTQTDLAQELGIAQQTMAHSKAAAPASPWRRCPRSPACCASPSRN